MFGGITRGLDRILYLIGLPGAVGTGLQLARGAAVKPVLIAVACATVVLWGAGLLLHAFFHDLDEQYKHWFYTHVNHAQRAFPEWLLGGTAAAISVLWVLALFLGVASGVAEYLSMKIWGPKMCVPDRLGNQSPCAVAGLPVPANVPAAHDQIPKLLWDLASLCVQAVGVVAILAALVAIATASRPRHHVDPDAGSGHPK